MSSDIDKRFLGGKLAHVEKYCPRTHIGAFANGGYSLTICEQTILGSYLETQNTAGGDTEAKPVIWIRSVCSC